MGLSVVNDGIGSKPVNFQKMKEEALKNKAKYEKRVKSAETMEMVGKVGQGVCKAIEIGTVAFEAGAAAYLAASLAAPYILGTAGGGIAAKAATDPKVRSIGEDLLGVLRQVCRTPMGTLDTYSFETGAKALTKGDPTITTLTKQILQYSNGEYPKALKALYPQLKQAVEALVSKVTFQDAGKNVVVNGWEAFKDFHPITQGFVAVSTGILGLVGLGQLLSNKSVSQPPVVAQDGEPKNK